MADRLLGDVVLASNRAASTVSLGLHAAAENLLVKALRAAGTGDHDRAGAYVARAVRLGFDEHEKVQPAWSQAHMLLFGMVVDALEERPADDHRWLDAALAVLADCGDYARTALLHSLAVVDHDWQLERQESRRIRAALDGIAWASEPEISPPGEEAEQVQAILQILDAVASYDHALDPTRG